VQILLRERFGLAPVLEPLSVNSTLHSTQADAVLLIGDRAIHSPPGNFATVWDLGDEWCRWSELPFVFAMWTARPGIELGNLEEVLSGARDEGVSHLSEIADREAAPLGLTRPQCLAYLRDNLHFTLGPGERAGLELFYNHAVSLGLAPPGVTFGFRDSAYSR
jgi:chorismate dehydratase